MGKAVHVPAPSGAVHETRPGSGTLQSPRGSGSKVRDGADGVVSRGSDYRVAMLGEAGVRQKMKPNWKAGVGIREAGQTQERKPINGVS